MIQKYLERLSSKEEERKKAERLKIGIYEDLKDGLLDKEEYQKLKAEFDSRIAEADAAVKELKRRDCRLEGSRSANAPWMNLLSAVWLPGTADTLGGRNNHQ